MNAVVSALLALLLGTSLIVTGSGLLGTALALGATGLGFSSSLTAVVMSAYFAGYVVGTYVCPKIVMRAGHVRAFSAFAATAASAVLLHSLLVSAPVWMLLRFVTGSCMVGLYMVIESWLNERATNESRGRVFALYQVISLLALAGGQYLILAGRNTLSTPFIVAGALFSIGLVPVVLTRVPHPAPITAVKLDLGKLWRISPLGVAGTGAAALANGALFALGPVFARRVDLSTAEVAVFMSLVMFGGIALQWPIGQLSDRWDRRRVILAVSICGAVLASVATALVGRSVPGMLAAVFLYGGAAFSLYPLSVAHSNDHVAHADFVATSSGLLLVYGIGAAIGPLLVGPLMQFVGPFTFLAFLAAMHGLLSLFVLIRMSVRPPPPIEEQEPFVMLGRTSQSALEMLAATDEAREPDRVSTPTERAS
ncbi:MAG TPA: MFS transporter [Gammaproteobacteria bacterium]|nr:MFS transporter [Gammaproteobacteria bacterium]